MREIRIRRLASDEGGQGMAEYILITVLVLVPLIGLIAPMFAAMYDYYNFISTVISLPIP